MLRRASQSLQKLCAEHSKDLEYAAFKRLHTSQPLRYAIETPASAAAAAAAASPAAPQSVPTLVKVLGFGGVIPFWAFSPVLAPSLPLDLLGDALASNPGTLQIGYGATIISFLGGVHWGLAMVQGVTPGPLMRQRYLWSVLPCLMAWPTVAMPIPQAAGLQAALLGIVYAVDRGWYRRGALPAWYIGMRLPLTVLAIGGLVLTAAGSKDE